MKSAQLQKSKNVTEMQKFRPVITRQKTMNELTQYTLPTFMNTKWMKIICKHILGTLKKCNK